MLTIITAAAIGMNMNAAGGIHKVSQGSSLKSRNESENQSGNDPDTNPGFIDKGEDGKYIVAIDPGHGGNDPGKIGINDKLEKDINLAIAMKLEKLLKKQDIEVVMTRTEDVGLYQESDSNKKRADMKKRVTLINESNADLCVSIHQNSYPDESVKGAQVFYYGQSQEGKKLAEALQQTLVEQLDPQNHRQAKANESYFLLKKTPSPTVIVECGFLSNYEEAELLKSEAYQKKVAEAVKTGILKCLNMDGKSSNSEAMGEKIQQ